MIQQFCEEPIPPQDTDEPRNGAIHAVKRRRVPNKDLAYRPPLSAKVTRAQTKSLESTNHDAPSVLHIEDISESGGMITVSSQVPNDFVEIGQSATSTIVEQQLYEQQDGSALKSQIGAA